MGFFLDVFLDLNGEIILKKTTLAILSLVLGGFASAGMYAPPAATCVPGDVTVPCEAKKWDIGARALYFKPIYGAERGYEFSPLNSYKAVEGEWDWGYQLEGSFHFNSGNDISMTWMHYDISSQASNYAGATPYSLSLVPFNLSLDNRFDQVNLVLGQYTDLGLLKNARFYGGLQYANIRVDTLNQYGSIPPVLAPLVLGGISLYRNTDFNGVGPVMGIDYSYDLTSGFSLTANAAGSLLYGTNRYSAGFIFSPSGVVPRSAYATKKAIIPSLETKLGINYAYEAMQGLINFEAGYQVLNYFDALETRGAIGFSSASTNNFGLYGPYLGLKWISNV